MAGIPVTNDAGDLIGNPAQWVRNQAAAALRGTALGASDLDAVKTPGFYYQPTDGSATTALHYPEARAGNLHVMAFGADGRTVQVYRTWYSNNTYTRSVSTNGTWTAWKQGGSGGSTDLTGYATEAYADQAEADAKAYSDGRRWQKTALSLANAQAYDGLYDGYYPVQSGDVAAAFGAPEGTFGFLVVFRNHASHRRLTWYPTDAKNVYSRRKVAGVWGDWYREVPDVAAGTQSTPGSGVKHQALSLTRASGDTAAVVTDEAVRQPVQYGASIPRWKIRARNWHSRTGNTVPASVGITGVWIGEGNTSTGVYASAPVQVVGPASTPADGSAWESEWINTPLNADTGYLLSVGVTTPAGQETATPMGTAWRGAGADNANATASPGAQSDRVPLDWEIIAEVPVHTPTVAAYGDSISSGSDADRPVFESWLSIHARDIGALPVHHTWPGTGMIEAVEWGADHHFTTYEGRGLARPDVLVHFMGQNDLASAADLATMQARFRATLTGLRDHVTENVHAATLTPDAGKTAALQQLARDYNAWLETQAENVKGVIDFAHVIGNAEGTGLLAEYDSGDGLHPNTAGYAALAGAVPVTLTSPAVATTAQLGALSAAVQDTGWRELTAAPKSPSRIAGGTLLVRRVGGQVFWRFGAVGIVDGEGTTPVLYGSEIPAGFSPYPVGTSFMMGNTSGFDINYLKFDTSLWWVATATGAAQSETRAGILMNGEITYWTDDAFPTTLPGVAA